MNADAYLQQVLHREVVDVGIFSPVHTVQATSDSAIRQWANRFLISVNPSGSFVKGTANKSNADIDQQFSFWLFLVISSYARAVVSDSRWGWMCSTA